MFYDKITLCRMCGENMAKKSKKPEKEIEDNLKSVANQDQNVE